jgi:hypothetical protein
LTEMASVILWLLEKRKVRNNTRRIRGVHSGKERMIMLINTIPV